MNNFVQFFRTQVLLFFYVTGVLQGKVAHQVPDDILNNPEIEKAANQLPQNYNFEIHKTIWRIRNTGAKRGIQIMYSTSIVLVDKI